MAAVMSVAVVVGLIFSWLPESFENKVVASEYGYTLFISEEGGAVVFSELKNSHASYKIVDELKKYGNTEYDLVITDISATSPDALSVLIKMKTRRSGRYIFPKRKRRVRGLLSGGFCRDTERKAAFESRHKCYFRILFHT